jgi:hypothetical protein
MPCARSMFHIDARQVLLRMHSCVCVCLCVDVWVCVVQEIMTTPHARLPGRLRMCTPHREHRCIVTVANHHPPTQAPVFEKPWRVPDVDQLFSDTFDDVFLLCLGPDRVYKSAGVQLILGPGTSLAHPPIG